jgi:hypothetical protein
MKKLHVAVAFALAIALLAGAVVVAGEASLTSGPQVDQKVPGPFHPLNVTGDKAGQKNCLYCANGTNPVAMVFAREVSPTVAKLIKKLDEETVKNDGCSMGSFVVFLSDKDGLEDQLKQMAKDTDLKKIVLSIDNPAGPKGYKVSQDADVTVVLYTDHTVKANHAFKKGDLTDKDIEKVVADVSKIVSSK